ncbi:MAG: phosphoglycolate phosphatase [Campylobacterota bacterium]|nr:phosphoglycolate phosphatase [Campylobacterota bacterium]
MKLEDKKLIIFDLDGTLIDSGDDLALALNITLQELGRQEFSEATIHQWVGNGAQTLVKRALSGSVDIDKNIDSALFQKALQLFLAHYKKNVCVKTKLYPNVKNTLQTLQNRGYTLAIVTNKPIGFVPKILEVLQIEQYFELTLGGDSLQEKKPSPMPLLHVCSELGFLPQESVMVGDSKNDILAAKAASMDSIGVTYGYNYGEEISIYEPTFSVDEFTKIIEL